MNIGQRPLHTDGLDVAAAHTHDLDVEQRQAWEEGIDILHGALSGPAGTVFLEVDVPRLGSRVDAVLISGPAVFAIEFKCGERQFEEIIERARSNREKAIVFVIFNFKRSEPEFLMS